MISRPLSLSALRRLALAIPIAILAACGGTTAPTNSSTGGGNTGGTSTMTVALPDVANATLGVASTCDGTGTSPAISWRGAPSNTAAFALVMSTSPTAGSTKYNWLLYNIPSTTTTLAAGATAGTPGQADDGGGLNYAPPCSQGPGLKQYTFTVYALSGPPTLTGFTPAQVTGAVLINALAAVTLTKTDVSVGVNRTVAQVNCGNVRQSITSYRDANTLDVTCDSTYAYFSTFGIQAKHAMMNGITATNQQVPIAQNFTGTNAWKIPLVPTVATTKTSALDGPIGIAVNGVPIFNPCKQGGCTGQGGGDTKLLGELDVCNGHAGRADDYHYHAAPICMMSDQGAAYWDTHPLGWALDGYAIFGYRNPDGSTATRDAVCGGNTVTHPNAPGGYAYHVTDVSPYVLSCFFGVPSPDLAGQGAKFSPLRPAGTPMPSTNMRLTTSAQALAIGGTSSMTWNSGGRAYEIRYSRTSALCWDFTLSTDGTATRSSYCRQR